MMSRNLVLRMLATIMLVLTTTGTVFAEDGDGETEPSWLDRELTLCQNGVELTDTFRALIDANIVVVFGDRFHLTGEDAYVGPCDESETPGNGDGSETSDNGDGSETPGNDDGDSETPGSGDGSETPGNGDGTEPGDNGNGGGTDTDENGNDDGTEIPAVTPNAFTLTLIQRMCADQSFNATWTGTNVVGIEFSLSNTSDNWTSGWLPANAETGSFTTAVDHHAYDKAVARVTFADGTSQVVDADVNLCVSVPANPPVTDQPSTPQKPVQVSALPTTGSGRAASISIVSLMAATLVLVTAGGMIVRGQRR